MVEPGFVGHTSEECDQIFRHQGTEDNDEVPELVDTSDDDVQLPDLEEVHVAREPALVGVLIGVLKSEVTPLYTDTPHTALHHHTTLRSETVTKNIPADILNKKDRFLGPVKCRRERERVSEIDLPLVTCAYSAPCGLVRREHFLTVWWYIIRL